MKKLVNILVLCFLLKSSTIYCQQILLYEGFESGVLNPMMSVQAVGAFNSFPGIMSNTNFGSTKAFGFGISTCPANCFYNYTSKLVITFPAATYVDSIKWSEMELYGNWGSWGDLYLDGVAITDTGMGVSPQNSLFADAFPRHQAYGVNQTVTIIELYVVDITDASEITIDDLEIIGNTTGINENSFASSIYLFPNPATNFFTIALPNVTEKVEISIADITGKIIYTTIAGGTQKIEVSTRDFAEGIYLVQVQSVDFIATKKLVVEK